MDQQHNPDRVSPAAGLRYAPLTEIPADEHIARKRRPLAAIAAILVTLGLVLAVPVTVVSVSADGRPETITGQVPAVAGANGNIKLDAGNLSKVGISVLLDNYTYDTLYNGEYTTGAISWGPPNFDGNQWRATWYCDGGDPNALYTAAGPTPINCNVIVLQVFPPG